MKATPTERRTLAGSAASGRRRGGRPWPTELRASRRVWFVGRGWPGKAGDQRGGDESAQHGVPQEWVSLVIGTEVSPTAQILRDRRTRYRGGLESWKEPGTARGCTDAATHKHSRACDGRSEGGSRVGLTVTSVGPAEAIEHSPSGSTGQLGCSSSQHVSAGSQQGLAIQGDAGPAIITRPRHTARINMAGRVAQRGDNLLLASRPPVHRHRDAGHGSHRGDHGQKALTIRCGRPAAGIERHPIQLTWRPES